MSKPSPARSVTLTDAPKTLFGARIGDRVRLLGPPWTGWAGRVVEIGKYHERFDELVVELDDGGRVRVLYRNDIEVLT